MSRYRIQRILIIIHMKQYKSLVFTFIATAIIVGAFAGVFYVMGERSDVSSKDTEGLAALATCLTERGAKFYGSFTCPHCQEQKKDFGDAVSMVPYIECSTPDGREQTQVCADAGITAYPTWVFANGEQVMGRVTLSSLAEATGCPAPAQ